LAANDQILYGGAKTTLSDNASMVRTPRVSD
jgi:hypothetical protein